MAIETTAPAPDDANTSVPARPQVEVWDDVYVAFKAACIDRAEALRLILAVEARITELSAAQMLDDDLPPSERVRRSSRGMTTIPGGRS